MITIKSLDGTKFVLLKFIMMEVESVTPYMISRSGLRENLREKTGRMRYVVLHTMDLSTRGMPEEQGPQTPFLVERNRVQLGCQVFTGENAAKLKTWIKTPSFKGQR
jgi:hypothetical protein